MKYVTCLFIVSVAAASMVTPAFGTLLKGTFNKPGDLTIDTNQSLEFLAPSATQGLTYNQILSSPFVTQDGFRVATVAEFEQLATDAGATDFSGNFTAADVPGVKNLISFLGETIPGEITLPAPGFKATISNGLYGFAIAPNTPQGFINVTGADSQSASLGEAAQDQARVIPELIQFKDGQQPPPIVGGLLVRTATPEPASVWLMGLGLSMLAGLSIWRKRRISLR
ncbi:MAG: PEP-CTERM sorting domain-containing protein [Terriglobia bacterium]